MEPAVSAAAGAASGHWLDLTTILLALAYALIQRRRKQRRGRDLELVSVAFASEVCAGMTLLPLVLVMGSAISETAATALLQTNRVILFVAGLFAILAILEDREPE